MSIDTRSETFPLMNNLSVNCIDFTIVENQSFQKSTTVMNNEKDNSTLQKRDFCYMNSNDDSISVMSHDEDDQSIDSGKKLGRKSIVEEYDEPENEENQIKRKAQNRAAQRAFRERKEHYVKELENRIRQVQDSHLHATTQLYQENQQLRFIIYRLELEISNLKGTTTFDHRPGNESCLLSIGPPPDLKALLPSSPPKIASLLPLQIRPASVEHCTLRIIPNSPDKKKKKVHHESTSENIQDTASNKSKKVITKKTSLPSTKSSPPNSTSSQQFTFAITTPATLRASSNSESARKNEQIQAVQLYPNHSHPANYLLEKNYKTKTDVTPALSPTNYSSNDSVISSSSDEEEKTADKKTQEFTDIMLLDTSGNFDFSEFTSDTISSPTLTLNQILASPSCQDWVTF